MKWIKGLLGYIWKLYFLLVVLITLLLFYPAYLILLLNEKYFLQGFKLTRFQARLILFLVGVRKEVYGAIPNDKETTYIICPNHSSYLDILILYSALPNFFIFLGKKELGKIPVFNIFFKKFNILVDRGNAMAAHASIEKACKAMEKGTNVVIFPEGTISKDVPKMRPFKNGAFKVALQLNIPIVPISLTDNYKLLEDSLSFYANARPGKSRIYIHPPIFINEDSPQDLLTLREETKQIIASKID